MYKDNTQPPALCAGKAPYEKSTNWGLISWEVDFIGIDLMGICQQKVEGQVHSDPKTTSPCDINLSGN